MLGLTLTRTMRERIAVAQASTDYAWNLLDRNREAFEALRNDRDLERTRVANLQAQLAKYDRKRGDSGRFVKEVG